jgi:hypothetical protein
VENRTPDRVALSVHRTLAFCGYSSRPQYIAVLCQRSNNPASLLVKIPAQCCLASFRSPISLVRPHAFINVGFRLRWLCMPFLFFFTGLSVLGSQHLTWPQGLSDLWSLSVVMWTIHVVSLLFCENPLEVLKRTDIQATSESTTRWQFRPAYKLLFNVRLLQCQRKGTGDSTNGASHSLEIPYTTSTVRCCLNL